MSIALIGNTLLDRSQDFGYLETLIQQAYPAHRLTVRNLAWSADSLHHQPRPANFADTDQHLVFVKADIIFAAYGFNESFAGPDGLGEFKAKLTEFVQAAKAKAFNGEKGPQLVLLSPIAGENITGVDAAKNNKNIRLYTRAMSEVAKAQQVGFINVFDATNKAMRPTVNDLTFNGCHLNDAGYRLFGRLVFDAAFDKPAPPA